MHGSQSQDIAECILRKTRDEEEKEAEDDAFMPDQIIKFFHRPYVNKLFNSHFFKKPCQAEGKPGTEYDSDHRIEKTGLYTEEVSSHEFDEASGNGGYDYLSDLDEDISQGRISAEGGDDRLQMMLIVEEIVKFNGL